MLRWCDLATIARNPIDSASRRINDVDPPRERAGPGMGVQVDGAPKQIGHLEVRP